jgi:hypothetical protein
MHEMCGNVDFSPLRMHHCKDAAEGFEKIRRKLQCWAAGVQGNTAEFMVRFWKEPSALINMTKLWLEANMNVIQTLASRVFLLFPSLPHHPISHNKLTHRC